jgi:hypothetical protein
MIVRCAGQEHLCMLQPACVETEEIKAKKDAAEHLSVGDAYVLCDMAE